MLNTNSKIRFTQDMGLLFTIFAKETEKFQVIKGQGYTEVSALNHAEQLVYAWIMQEKIEGRKITIISKDISYEMKSELTISCHIMITYKTETNREF